MRSPDDHDYEDHMELRPRRRRRRRRDGAFGRAVRGTALIAIGGVIATVAIFVVAGIPGNPLSPVIAANTALEPPPEPVDVPDSSLIGKQAEAWGIRQCLAEIVALSDALTRDADYSYRLVRGETEPDKEILTGTVAAGIAAEGTSGLARFHVAPIAAGGCNSAYQTVVYHAEPCSETWTDRYQAYSQRLDFGGTIAAAFATPEGNAGLYLLPAGESGCVAVRTESLYR